MKPRSNGDTCHYILESKLSFKPQRSDKIPVLESIFIKLKSIAENKIMQKNKSSYNIFRRVTPARFLTPKSFFIAQKKMTTRELSLAPDSQISTYLKWPLAPYLKENFPTASSSDPCGNDLDRWWRSRHLLISSVDLLKNNILHAFT